MEKDQEEDERKSDSFVYQVFFLCFSAVIVHLTVSTYRSIFPLYSFVSSVFNVDGKCLILKLPLSSESELLFKRMNGFIPMLAYIPRHRRQTFMWFVLCNVWTYSYFFLNVFMCVCISNNRSIYIVASTILMNTSFEYYLFIGQSKLEAEVRIEKTEEIK